jgi:hypothetical protein
MGETMAYEKVGAFVVCVHPVQEPNDADWNGYLAFLKQHERVCDSVFVYSVGGGPNLGQRRALAEATVGRTLFAAVITPSRVTRAIGVAVSWLNPHVRMFAPGYLKDALAYLKLGPREAADVLYSARQLAKGLCIARADLDLVVEIQVRHAG